jgi:HPt (histidine-containing phosphotransfer) domain-containing protein
MDDYLSKPFKGSELAQVLKRWLLVPAVAESNHGGEEREGSLLDQSVVDSIRTLNETLLPKMIAAWLVECPRLHRELHEAMNNKDAGALFRAAHALKNSTATIGALPLASLCNAIELLGRADNVASAKELMRELDQLFLRTEEAIRIMR